MEENIKAVYQAIENASEVISEAKAKKMAVSIIEAMKQQQLTYSQAYEVLKVTRATLLAMSELLAL